MAEEQNKIQELLKDQSNVRDPFAQARDRFKQSKIKRTAETFDPFETPLEPDEERVVTEPTELVSTPEQPTFERMMAQPTQTQLQEFGQSKLPESFEKIGIPGLAEGLSFTPLGKLQLITRLKERFGEGFETNPQVQEALTLFEQGITSQSKEDKDTAEQELNGIANAGRRTLSALLGGI